MNAETLILTIQKHLARILANLSEQEEHELTVLVQRIIQSPNEAAMFTELDSLSDFCTNHPFLNSLMLQAERETRFRFRGKTRRGMSQNSENVRSVAKHLIDEIEKKKVLDDFRSEKAAPTKQETTTFRGGGRSAKTDEPAETISRYPDATLPEKVALGQECILRVAVTQKPGRQKWQDERMELAITPKAESTKIEVLVTARDFEILGSAYQILVVPRAGDSDPLLCKLLPKSLGAKKVKVEFFQNARYVGGVAVETTVLPGEKIHGARPTRARGVIGLGANSRPPDLTMLITESTFNGKSWKYKFTLHAPAIDFFYHTIQGELEFSVHPSAWIEGLFQEIESLWHDSSAEDISETMRTIGSDLYEKLFPHELKQHWKERIRAKVNSIMIISDEPWIPWEMIRPSHDTAKGGFEEDGFLCEDYLLSRWIAGPPPPSLVNIRAGALIAPLESELPNVENEAVFVRSLGDISVIEPRLNQVRKLLKTGGYHLLHFACHGSFEAARHEQSTIYLDGEEEFKSRDITGERKNFGKDRPFVFLNACQTGRAEFSLVGIGSWADKFVNARASGFLGAAWEVNDELACEFSQSFYDALRRGLAVGEAMQKARTKIKGAAEDPTWLAYTLFADPHAKVSFQ